MARIRKVVKKNNSGLKIGGLTALVCGGIAAIAGFQNTTTENPEDNRPHPTSRSHDSKFSFLQGHTPTALDDISRKLNDNMALLNQYQLVKGFFDTDVRQPDNAKFIPGINATLMGIQEELGQQRIKCSRLITPKVLSTGIRIVEDKLHGYDLKKYFEFSERYMRNHDALSDLPHPTIEFLLPGEAKTDANSIPAYIALAKIQHVKYPINCVSENRVIKVDGEQFDITMGSSVSFSMIRYNSKTSMEKEEKPFVILGCSEQSPDIVFSAAFSELLPIALYDGMDKFVDDNNHLINTHKDLFAFLKEESQLTETISESLSYQLTVELLDDPNLSKARNFVSKESLLAYAQDRARAMPDEYGLVPAGIKYIEMHGMKMTVQNFMNDPVKYFSDVKEIHASMN